MNKTITIFLLVAAFLLNFGCEKDFSPQQGDTNTTHSYFWNVDTLFAPDALQVMMSGIWGTDENNVWVVGHSSESKYQVWHWNGTKWGNRHVRFPGHTFSLNAIYGFAENDVWAVGTEIQNYPNIIHRGIIIHFDGVDWRLAEIPTIPPAFSIWGSGPSRIFVGCDSGIVLSYDGANWQKSYTNTLSQIVSLGGVRAEHLYAIGIGVDDLNPVDTTFYSFFEFKENEWQIKSSYATFAHSPMELFGTHLWVSPKGEIYSAGAGGVYLLEKDSWHRIRDENLYTIFGASSNNIFTGGKGNYLLHYDGNDWVWYENLVDNTINIAAIWGNDTNVFVVARPYYQTIIYRGSISH